MSLAQHYRTLGLRRGASSREVKSAYRTLVRQYHPDINPDEAAVEQFIKINDAYTALSENAQRRERAAEARGQQAASNDGFSLENLKQTLEKLGISPLDDESVAAESAEKRQSAVPADYRTDYQAGLQSEMPPAPSAEAAVGKQVAEPLSDQEESLKQEAYRQLKELLRHQKFPRAIALVEGLAHRMPADIEINQWQAIVYQRWGRQLIQMGQPQKARIYLKKALRTDPNNQSLWREINRDFWQLASFGRADDLESEGL